VALVAVVLGGLLLFLLLRRHDGAIAQPTAGSAAGRAGLSDERGGRPGQPALVPPAHVRRITEDQRRALVEQIAAAHARRAAADAAHSTAPAAGGEPATNSIDLEHVSAPVKDALGEAIPLLAECYEKTGKHQPRAGVMMTLFGDPSVGTLIDPTQLVDAEGKPLEPALDRCLRDTFGTLELPPLDEGDKLELQYTFKFDD